MIKKIIAYLKSVIGETKKISWPTKKQVFRYAILVLTISFFVGMFLGLIDWLIINSFRKFIV